MLYIANRTHSFMAVFLCRKSGISGAQNRLKPLIRKENATAHSIIYTTQSKPKL
jgi:hypothetical protein